MVLTPTQQRLYDKLADGYPHEADSLLSAIDVMADRNLLRAHIFHLKKALDLVGMTVVSDEKNGGCSYRLARYISVEE